MNLRATSGRNPRSEAVTMNDVARRAGVSLKTVSNVVNDYPYVRKETRKRVEDAIRELGYQVNVSARNLRRGRTGLLSLAVPELGVPYFAELAQTMTTAAEKRGLRVVLELSGGDPEKERRILASPDRSMADALIYSPLGLTQDQAHLLQVNYPLILLGERIFSTDVDHVTMSNVEGARAATDHLFQCGARRIALLGHHPWPEISSASLRFEGYRNALHALGMPVEPELLLPAGPWRRATGADALRRALDQGIKFDAVFAMNDAMALGALHVIQERGFSVPEDIQVIGFDNIEESQFSTPTLTTISPGREQIAETALDLAQRRISQTGPEQRQLITAPYELVWRHTTKSRT